jgi:hypothetical protein
LATSGDAYAVFGRIVALIDADIVDAGVDELLSSVLNLKSDSADELIDFIVSSADDAQLTGWVARGD